MGSKFQYGLFGCFGDFRLCAMTFCCPCYTVGKNAEGIGEDCMLHGLLYIVGLNFAPIIRWRLREQKSLDGTMLMDVLFHTVCPCCALVQEARELGQTGDSVKKYIDEQKAGGVEHEQSMDRE